LPGRRLFQYRSEVGELRAVTAREVNSFLRDIADEKISLKDFRTLFASARVLKALAGAAPAGSARHRRKQVKEAVQTAADELANTPTICRRSYVHDTVVEAFEEGALEPISEKLKSKSLVRSAQAVAEIVGRADLTGA
jgi:DNA topoisomerase-1